MARNNTDVEEHILTVSDTISVLTFKNTPNNFLAGKISKHISQWMKITQDQNVLNSVQGIKLNTNLDICQAFIPKPIKFNASEMAIMEQEMLQLQAKGIVVQVTPHFSQYISNVFMRPKKDGSFRIILNLRSLNQTMEKRHFKMNTLKTAINLMTQNCWFASVDLKDAYFSVAIHKDHKKFFRFVWKNDLFEFQAMPNGLSPAPREFTKILTPVFASLRERGFLNVFYIDDTLLLGDSYDECFANVKQTADLLDSLGFTIHPRKSVFQPAQDIVFLGFILDSKDMSVRLTPEKITIIVKECTKLKMRDSVKIQTVSQLVGKLVATAPGVPLASLYFKTLELEMNIALNRSHRDYDSFMRLSPDVKCHLQWWIENLAHTKRSVFIKKPDIILQSDSSMKGWGGVLEAHGQSTGGHWSADEQEFHINFLELMAGFLTLQSFCRDKTGLHIRLMMDNQVAVTYIDHMGGRIHRLNELTRTIWLWALSRQIWLSAAHLPGVDNTSADRLSRKLHDDMEWKLNVDIFNQIQHLFGHLEIDMFATRLNSQLPGYVSWRPDPQALAVDAFTLNWTNTGYYMFPPFSLIGPILHKLEGDQGRAVLVFPLWKTQAWFPKLLSMITGHPRLLPQDRQLLTLVHKKGYLHNLHKTLVLAVAPLSGKQHICRDYRQGLLTLSLNHGKNPQNNSIGHISRNGKTFVCKGVSIPFSPLYH